MHQRRQGFFSLRFSSASLVFAVMAASLAPRTGSTTSWGLEDQRAMVLPENLRRNRNHEGNTMSNGRGGERGRLELVLRGGGPAEKIADIEKEMRRTQKNKV